MANDETDRLIGEIGQLLAEDAESPLDATLLYARVRSTMIAASIFKDRGNASYIAVLTWAAWVAGYLTSGMPKSRTPAGPKSSISFGAFTSK